MRLRVMYEYWQSGFVQNVYVSYCGIQGQILLLAELFMSKIFYFRYFLNTFETIIFSIKINLWSKQLRNIGNDYLIGFVHIPLFSGSSKLCKKYALTCYYFVIPGAVLPSLFSLVRFLYVTVNKSVFLFLLSLYSFLWPTHSIFFLFVCLIVFQEDLCGHDRNIIETVDCQWEYNNSGDKYSMWLPKNHQFSLKENLSRIFCVVNDVSMCM